MDKKRFIRNIKRHNCQWQFLSLNVSYELYFFSFPEYIVHYLISFLHVRVFLYKCVGIDLQNRSYSLAVGCRPFNEPESVRVACLHEVDVIVAEYVRYYLVFRLPIVHTIGRKCSHGILYVG